MVKPNQSMRHLGYINLLDKRFRGTCVMREDVAELSMARMLAEVEVGSWPPCSMAKVMFLPFVMESGKEAYRPG